MADELTEIVLDEEELGGWDFTHETRNIAEELQRSEDGEAELKKLFALAEDRFRTSWESMRRFREKAAEVQDIYAGEIRARGEMANAIQAHLPTLIEAVGRIHARLETEIFGDWTNPVGVLPVGPDDEATADIQSRFLNWQVRNEIPDFQEQLGDRGILAFLLLGSVFGYNFFDVRAKQPRSIILTPDEFCFPYAYKTTMPDFSDLPHYSYIQRLYEYELRAMEDLGWVGVDDVIKAGGDSFDDEPDAPVRRSAGEIVGEEDQESSTGEDTKQISDRPYKIIQQEGWVRVPGQDDARWCQIVFHEASQTVLSFTIHEEVDWRDIERERRQTMEFAQYEQSLVAFEQQRQAAEIMRKATDATSAAVPDPQPPVAPEWMDDPDGPLEGPKPARLVPICRFAHGKCFPLLSGGVGLGFGRVVGDYNKTGDTLLSEYLEGARRHNAPTMLAAGNMKFSTGASLPVKAGKIIFVKGVTPNELKNSMMELRVSPPAAQMLDGVERMHGWGQGSVQATDVLSGEPGKSGETFRGIASRIEQATKQQGIIAKRYVRFVRQMYINIARINGNHLPEEQVWQVVDDRSVMGQGPMTMSEPVQVRRGFFRRNYQVEIRSDLKFTSEAQRISEHNEIVQLAFAYPPLQMNGAIQHAVIKRALELRNRHDLAEKLGQEPQPPQFYGTPSNPPPGAQPKPPGPPGGPQGAPPGGPR